jgi:hypothetical protein
MTEPLSGGDTCHSCHYTPPSRARDTPENGHIAVLNDASPDAGLGAAGHAATRLATRPVLTAGQAATGPPATPFRR